MVDPCCPHIVVDSLVDQPALACHQCGGQRTRLPADGASNTVGHVGSCVIDCAGEPKAKGWRARCRGQCHGPDPTPNGTKSEKISISGKVIATGKSRLRWRHQARLSAQMVASTRARPLEGCAQTLWFGNSKSCIKPRDHKHHPPPLRASIHCFHEAAHLGKNGAIEHGCRNKPRAKSRCAETKENEGQPNHRDKRRQTRPYWPRSSEQHRTAKSCRKG